MVAKYKTSVKEPGIPGVLKMVLLFSFNRFLFCFSLISCWISVLFIVCFALVHRLVLKLVRFGRKFNRQMTLRMVLINAHTWYEFGVSSLMS